MLFAGARGYLDDIDVGDVRRFEAELLDCFEPATPISSSIVSTGKIDEDELEAGIKAFTAGFVPRRDPRRRRTRQRGAAGANTAKVTAPTHLPEEEITLVDSARRPTDPTRETPCQAHRNECFAARSATSRT